MENKFLKQYNQIVNTWKNKEIHTSQELEAALIGYIVNFAYNSGKIENQNITYYDTREIFNNDRVISYTGDIKTLFEIRNSKDANQYIMYAFDNKFDVDIDFIKKIQYELTKNTYDSRRYSIGERPGEFKKHEYITGKHDIGASSEDVVEELSELINEIQDTKITGENILTVAAYFHTKFENIHPFADGNGRTGRLLTNYLFIKNNHLPLIFQEKYKKLYYNCLEKWDIEQDLQPMIKYLMFEISETWSKKR